MEKENLNEYVIRVITVNHEGKFEVVDLPYIDHFNDLNRSCILDFASGTREEMNKHLFFPDRINRIHEEHQLEGGLTAKFDQHYQMRNLKEIAENLDQEQPLIHIQPEFCYGENLVMFNSKEEQEEFLRLYETGSDTLKRTRKPPIL